MFGNSTLRDGWKSVAIGGALCALLRIVPASAETLQPRIERSYPYPETDVVLGQGWDTARGVATPAVCIEFSPKLKDGHETVMRFERVTSRTDLMKKLSLDAKAGFSSSFSASASVKFVKSAKFKADSENLLARVVIEKGSVSVAPFERTDFTDGYKKLLADYRAAALAQMSGQVVPPPVATASGSGGIRYTYAVEAPAPVAGIDTVTRPHTVALSDEYADLLLKQPKRFRELCGDSFVAYIERGAELNAILNFDAVEKSQRQDMMRSFSVGGFGASVGGNRSESESKITKDSGIVIDVLQIGGALAPTPTSLDQFLATVQSFAAGFENMGVAPNGFRITARGYEEITPAFGTDRKVDRMRLAYLLHGVFSDLVEKYEDVVVDLSKDGVPASVLETSGRNFERDKYRTLTPLDTAEAPNGPGEATTSPFEAPVPGKTRLICGVIEVGPVTGYQEYRAYSSNVEVEFTLDKRRLINGIDQLNECIEAEALHPWQEASVFERYRFAMFVRVALERGFNSCATSDDVRCIDEEIGRLLCDEFVRKFDLDPSVRAGTPRRVTTDADGCVLHIVTSPGHEPTMRLATDVILRAFIDLNINQDLASQLQTEWWMFSPFVDSAESMVSAIDAHASQWKDETGFAAGEAYRAALGQLEEFNNANGGGSRVSEFFAVSPTAQSTIASLTLARCTADDYVESCLADMRARTQSFPTQEQLKEELEGHILLAYSSSFGASEIERALQAAKDEFCTVSPFGLLMNDCTGYFDALRKRYDKMSDLRTKKIGSVAFAAQSEDGRSDEDAVTEALAEISGYDSQARTKSSFVACSGGYSSVGEALRLYECLFTIALRLNAQLPMRHTAFKQGVADLQTNFVTGSTTTELTALASDRQVRLLQDASDLAKITFIERLEPIYDLLCDEPGLGEICATRATYALNWASYGPGWAFGSSEPACRPQKETKILGGFIKSKPGKKYVLKQSLPKSSEKDSTRTVCAGKERRFASTVLLP